jgi:hypothetical protein
MTGKHGKSSQRIFSILALIALIAGTVLPAAAQTRRPRLRRSTRVSRPSRTTIAPVYYTVNANQTIRVRMNERISSANARVGDTFTTTVVDPVYASGVEVIPAGSIIVGRVTQVKRAARQSKAGVLGVEFISVKLPTGYSRAMNGSLTSMSDETATYDNEGQVTGNSSTKRNVVFIGGGAAAGALIGAIAGGGKGAGIGAGIGAGLGVAGALLSKGKEAEVRPGTEFGVILNQSLSLPAANVR